jgi:bifunctional non-homologous end joining protein LigD
MSLKRYVEKRRFDETPEPAPQTTRRRKRSAPMFCVQRHHASHLHYDLRLEVDGALKSWAVPKGPTLDPNEKRLAMMVEDHPIEYGDFEGVIPTGNYGAGSVMLWDRGTYELLGEAPADEQLGRGDFKFRLTGRKISGEFALVLMKPRSAKSKGNEWLLIKKRDAAAQPGWDTEDYAVSVLTGRSQEEIAQQLPPREVDPDPSEDDPPGNDPPASAEGLAEGKASFKKAARLKRREWPEGAQTAPMPKIITPMLAELGKRTPLSGEDWLYEIKWDGVRATCFIEDGHLRMTSRNGNVMERQYPELAVLPRCVNAKQAILDAEITLLDSQGRPSFELLQKRINVADAASVARLARSSPATLFVFDLLYLDGHDLRNVPLQERKKLLEEVFEPTDHIRLSTTFPGHGPELLAAVEHQGLEGIVGKRIDSKYEPRRSSQWMKWKVSASDDFLICGYTPGERHGLGALVLGTYRDGKLSWAGNVGTGFDRKMVEILFEKLKPLVTRENPFERAYGGPIPHGRGSDLADLPKQVTWVKPELVCEVKFANWTQDGRLRAPVFVGLRADIDPPSERHALLLSDQKETTVTVDGHRLKFTHLDKVFYPTEGYVKRDLLNYYDAVAPLILPHLKDRPLSLKRYPNGIASEFFFQKNLAAGSPDWLETVMIDKNRHVVGNDRATLLYLVNLGCIDHNPWMSRVGSLEHPDYILIDLDPQECTYDRIVEAALWVRAKLDKAGLESHPKTTGGDGMHIFIPIEPVYTYEHARSFAEALSTLGAHERPDLFTTPRSVSKREKGKVYFDWQQIAEGKTISAPYVLRAYPGAPVATPLEWSEVTPKLRPEQFHLGNVLRRFDRNGDLFRGVLDKPQRIETAIEKLL